MKKYLIITAVIMSLLAVSCSKYKYEKVADDPLKTRIYTLDNGLKIYMSVNKEVPRIQTYIAVKVGGKNDPAETTGLAHYFEHLMFKGTQQYGTSDYAAEKPLLDQIESLFEAYRKTTDEAERAAIYHKIDSISYEASKYSIPNEYDKLMAVIGANGTNAYTAEDMTVYVEDIPSNQIDNWAKIQADRFKNIVIRGFHTELETIYEEKNMSLTRDGEKVYEAIAAALYPNHPYGTQTVLGTQQSLKNPSITNVKMYHDQYYVPNNMAICVSGDFDPDQMIATIDKYFGDMKPNEELPQLQFEPEKPISTPISKEVFGLEAENVTLAWRTGGASTTDAEMTAVASSILYNGKAGLIDLDINQQQKTLGAYAYPMIMADYGAMYFGGSPKAGQSLEEVRDLILAEVDKLRNGDFDEALLAAALNNYKLQIMQYMDSNRGRADMYVQSFINGTSWADEVQQLDRMSKISKQDIVDWANKTLGKNSYAVVYKREGKDPNEQKMPKPKITPIETNRDNQSQFLIDIKNAEVTPIEPIFVDYQKDMSKLKAQSQIEVLYKKNETTDMFQLIYLFDIGTTNDPALNAAFSYIDYLGTVTKTAEQIASEMYGLACDYSLFADNDRCYVVIDGLSENMGKAMEIFEDLIANAKPDEAILANMKADLIKSRADDKLNQGRNFGALIKYVCYGGDAVKATTLTNPQLEALTSEELLGKVKDLMTKQHIVMYYGPKDKEAVVKDIETYHHVPATLTPLQPSRLKIVDTDENRVVLGQYDAKQLYYLQFANLGEAYNHENTPAIRLYNEYFGGGMNSIVFQEMREARGLAYTAQAWLEEPLYAGDNYQYTAFIATQNDKMEQAIVAFDDIINNMPESEAAFNLAKESLLAGIRTIRTTKSGVLWSYYNNQLKGLNEDPNRLVYEKVQNMTLDDVKAAQQKWAKDRKFVYAILGDAQDINLNYLKTLGPIQMVSQEEIFGY